MNAQARAEGRAVRDAVGEHILEIPAHAVVRLHPDDVGAVCQEQDIVCDLEVMRAGVDSGGEEADRFQLARIGGVENRHAIAEHVADVDMAAVDHDLDAVGATALIAMGQVPNPSPDALRSISSG